MSTVIKLPNGKRVIVSDRARMMPGLAGLGCGCDSGGTLAGLGFAAGIASNIALGAKAGSIIPGVGNVIGAVVGAVSGLLGKKKPVRPSGQQVADCQILLKEYENFAAQNPPPMGRTLGPQQLKDLYWCIQATSGGHYLGVKDPRWFDGGFILDENLARKTVRAVFSTPVGATVTVQPDPWTDPKGRVIKSNGFSFTNGPFISLQDLNEKYFLPAVIQVCKDTAGKGAPGCPDYHNLPVMKRLMLDLLDYAASVELPQVEASKLSPPTQSAAPTQSVPLPTGTGLPAQGAQPAQPTLLPVSVAPSLPSPTISTPASTAVSSLDSQISNLVQSLLSQGASQQQAFTSALQSLNSRGVAITPDVQNAVASEIKSSGGSMAQLPLIVAGVAGLVGVILIMRKRGR